MTFFAGVVIAYVLVAFKFCLDATSPDASTGKMLGPVLIDSGLSEQEDFSDQELIEDGLENTVTIIEPHLEELPTNPMALAILKSTFTPEQLASKRVPPASGALPGEILDELPIEQVALSLQDADEEHVHVRLED